MQYILDDDGEPQPCEDLQRWAVWMSTADRIVLRNAFGPLIVSTVFLGLDHRHWDGGDPVLWETMVFDVHDCCLDEHTRRYTSKLDALDGHREVCVAVEQLATTGNKKFSAEK